MTEKQYSITELAKEFDVTTRTIRFYEDKGLLKPRREGQTRIYSPSDRIFLKLILRGKRIGFSLKESQEIIELYDPTSGNTFQLSQMLEKIADKTSELDQQIHDIEIMKIELAEAGQRCQAALDEALKNNQQESDS